MADLTVSPGATFEAVLDGAPTGLTGTLTVGIYDTPNELVALYGPSTTGIVENPPGSGLYAVTLTAPATPGVYSIVWNNQGVMVRDTLTVGGTGAGTAVGATFEATLDGAPTGRTGILTVGIYDTPNELVALYGPSPAGIIENPAGSGLYAVTLTAPATAGVYSVVWNNNGVTARDTLTVGGTGAGTAPGTGAAPGAGAGTASGRIGRITLADALGVELVLNDVAVVASRGVNRAAGLQGLQSVRDSRRMRPSAHGAINETRFEGERLVTLDGWCATLADLRMVSAKALASLDAPGVLKWTERDGLALQCVCKASALTEGAGKLVRYQLQLVADDPRAYSQTLSVSQGVALTAVGGGDVFPDVFPDTFAASSGGVVSWVNAGNRPSPPLLRIYGQVVNPQIVQQGTNRRLVLVGEVAAGDYLELDVARRTVRRFTAGSSLPAQGMVNSALSTWFELAPGPNTLTLVADNFDATARADVIARAAYT